MTEVKNLNGTSDNEVPEGYSSWKDFWQQKTGRNFGICSCKGCSKLAKHGSHVQKVDENDRKWYIVPLCKPCNVGKKNTVFEVRDADLVWVGTK